MIAPANRLTSQAHRRPGAWVIAVALVLMLSAPSAAAAQANSARMLTYLPTELLQSPQSPEQVARVIGELQEYDIGQALFQMPRFTKKGTIKLPETNRQMLRVWAQAAASYNAAHGTDVTVTAVFNGRPRAKGLDLELPATRANIVATVQAVLADGITGVQLDIEPFPTGTGYLALLRELDEALAREGFDGRVSVVAPGDNWTWSPEYLHEVGALVSQVDPTFYDTEYATVSAYQELIEEGLAAYSANVPASTWIIPVIPCYSPDPWHDPAIENVPSATAALATSLSEGSRVDGAGLWWWYAFYGGHYKHGNPAVEQAAWQSQTVNLAYSP